MTEDKCLNGRLDVGCYGHVYGDLSGAEQGIGREVAWDHYKPV